ncbi:protein of unknown function [Streptomyces sp. KY70]|nr:protein of unknown function [Streptomyces sp. KY70]
MDAAARVGGGRGQVQPLHRGLGAARARHRAEHQLLVHRRRAPVDRAVVEVAVGCLKCGWCQDPPGQDAAAEAGSVPLHLLLHPVRHPLLLVPAPRAGQAVRPGVLLHAVGDMGVGPGRLGAPGRTGRVRRGHLPEEEEGAVRDQSACDLGGPPAELVDALRQVHGPRRGRCRAVPRDGGVQRPVHLERGEVPLEPPHVVEEPVRQMLRGDQRPVQAGGGHIGEDRPAGLERVPGRGTDPHGPALPDDDLAHPLSAPHLSPACLQPPDQGRGEGAGAPDRDRKAVGLPQHGHQPAEAAAARRLGSQIRVQRVAGEQEPAALAGELLLAEPAYGKEKAAGQPQPARRPQPGEQLPAGEDRRERGEERGDDVVAQPVPDTAQVQPALPVAGGEAVEGLGGGRPVAVQHGTPAVQERVGEHPGSTAPAEPLPFEVQRRQHGGDRRQWVERAEQVVDIGRMDLPVTADRATRLVLFFQDLHRPVGVRQHIGGHQAVGTASDHYRVDHGTALRPGARARGGSPGSVGGRCGGTPAPVRLRGRHPFHQPGEARQHGAVAELEQGVEQGIVQRAAEAAQRVLVDDHEGPLAPRPDVEGDTGRPPGAALRLQLQRARPVDVPDDGAPGEPLGPHMDVVGDGGAALGPTAALRAGIGGPDHPFPVQGLVLQDRPDRGRRPVDEVVPYGHDLPRFAQRTIRSRLQLCPAPGGPAARWEASPPGFKREAGTGLPSQKQGVEEEEGGHQYGDRDDGDQRRRGPPPGWRVARPRFRGAALGGGSLTGRDGATRFQAGGVAGIGVGVSGAHVLRVPLRAAAHHKWSERVHRTHRSPRRGKRR